MMKRKLDSAPRERLESPKKLRVNPEIPRRTSLRLAKKVGVPAGRPPLGVSRQPLAKPSVLPLAKKPPVPPVPVREIKKPLAKKPVVKAPAVIPAKKPPIPRQGIPVPAARKGLDPKKLNGTRCERSLTRLVQQFEQKRVALENIHKEAEKLKEDKKQLLLTIKRLESEQVDTKLACARQVDALTCQYELEKTEWQLRYDNLFDEHEVLVEENAVQKQTIYEYEDRINRLEDRSRWEETTRKKLHNTILELKGNIRVFCRVRPFLKHEADNADHMEFPDTVEDRQIVISEKRDSVDGTKVSIKKHEFEFDRVFYPGSTQEQVFDEIQLLVQSALDGYKVCIFAYGQTGSGKTHTMEGPTIATAADQGMIPRTLTKIYQESNRLKEKGWEYEIEAEFIEIYNDTLQDLLNLGTKKTLEIKKDPAGNTYITNTKRVAVKSEAAIRRVLEMARGNRTTASTNANERSSRSHSVFMLHLHGTHTVTGEEIHGVLNLIDLAGSERVALSGAKGDRLKEAQAINKSLSALGDVIEALNKPNGAHVPYRNSKLTYLLHSSLGGDSKVLMFVNINPASASCAETLSSLRFAAKVNTTQLNNK